MQSSSQEMKRPVSVGGPSVPLRVMHRALRAAPDQRSLVKELGMELFCCLKRLVVRESNRNNGCKKRGVVRLGHDRVVNTCGDKLVNSSQIMRVYRTVVVEKLESIFLFCLR